MVSAERNIWNRKCYGKGVRAEYLNDSRGGWTVHGSRHSEEAKSLGMESDQRLCFYLKFYLELRNGVGTAPNTEHGT